eukprot:6490019-Amphidinium_carterae.1
MGREKCSSPMTRPRGTGGGGGGGSSPSSTASSNEKVVANTQLHCVMHQTNIIKWPHRCVS